VTIPADRNSTHLAGEYFVAAELYRRGYSVALTLGNAKAIDLYAGRDVRTVNVQVKAIAKRASVGWPMMRDKVVDGIVYIFVLLNDAPRPPEYFIATADEARAKVKQFKTRGIVDLRSLQSDAFRERWDKVELGLTSPAARPSPRSARQSHVSTSPSNWGRHVRNAD
jgi:hypothetical protein